MIRSTYLAALLLASGLTQAQETPNAGQNPAVSATPAHSAQAQSTQTQDEKQSLIDAYQREFAFLEEQKRQLEAALKKTRSQQQAQKARLEQQIQSLEESTQRQQIQLEQLNKSLLLTQQQLDSAQERRQGFEATLEQAGLTLKEAGFAAEIQPDQPASAKVKTLLEQANALLDQGTRLRLYPDSFFLADGTLVQGQRLDIGQIASLGDSSQGGGALAPAGEGKMKVWPEGDAETARSVVRALAKGQAVQSSTVPLYLYESTRNAVELQKDKTVLETIDAGGVIAWVIVGLGGFALLLILLRIFFLYRASASISRIAQSIGERVRQGQVKEAMELCKKSNSAICRVIVTTLRNLDRDREHLEDIISEAILHESVFLNRFGTPIMVVAAVAPLLGLLGTVTGMISTFDIITEFGTGDPKLLSSGISVALITTEIGLVVAIPALIAGNLLSSWAENIKTDTERAALKVMNLYQDYLQEHAPAPNHPPGHPAGESMNRKAA